MAKYVTIPILAPHGSEVAHVLGSLWLGSLLAFVVAAFAQLVNEGLWRAAAVAAVVVALMLLVVWRNGTRAEASRRPRSWSSSPPPQRLLWPPQPERRHGHS